MRQIRQMKHEIFIANTNQTFHKVNLQSDPPTPNINPWSPKQIYCSSLKSTWSIPHSESMTLTGVWDDEFVSGKNNFKASQRALIQIQPTNVSPILGWPYQQNYIIDGRYHKNRFPLWLKEWTVAKPSNSSKILVALTNLGMWVPLVKIRRDRNAQFCSNNANNWKNCCFLKTDKSTFSCCLNVCKYNYEAMFASAQTKYFLFITKPSHSHSHFFTALKFVQIILTKLDTQPWKHL